MSIRTAFLALLVAFPLLAQQQRYPDEKGVPPQVNQRFKGVLTFKINDRAVNAPVQMSQWHIANDESVEIPHDGLLIIHLRAGALKTRIGTVETQRKEDTYWAVPAGERFVVVTERDSVILHIVEIVTK